MTTLKPIENVVSKHMTTFVFSNRVEILVRSADWYNFPPILRYLYNMAASEIRMEDAKTETRVYTYQRYRHMRDLMLRSIAQEWEAAWEAYVIWWTPELSFGVVHLEQSGELRGNIIVGDEPVDFAEFAPDEPQVMDMASILMPSHGVEGSDA